MGIYDLIMLAVMVGSILFGMWKGLAWQVASLAAIFVSYFVAILFRGPVSGFISATEPWNKFAAMAILFFGTSLVIWMGYGYVKKQIKRLSLRGFDFQAGAILGALKGAILCMLITLFSVTLFGERVRDGVISSRSGAYITAAINKADAFVPSEIHAVLDPHIQKFNENLVSGDPDFLERSKLKLEQNIQTFKGFLEVPKERLATNPQSRSTSVPGQQDGPAASPASFEPPANPPMGSPSTANVQPADHNSETDNSFPGG